MHLVVLLAALCAAPAVVAVVWAWNDPKRRARRLLAGAVGKPLGAVVAGDRVRVLGIAQRKGDGLEAPFTGRRCIGFRAIVEEFVSDGEEGDWREIAASEDCVPFELAAEGSEARVEGPFLLGLEIDARSEDDPEVTPAASEGFLSLGVSRENGSGRARRLRFREAALEHGDPIWVLGDASVVVDRLGRPESPRGQPVKRVIRGTKGAPTVVADEDQPGVLAPFG